MWGVLGCVVCAYVRACVGGAAATERRVSLIPTLWASFAMSVRVLFRGSSIPALLSLQKLYTTGALPLAVISWRAENGDEAIYCR